ncbi:MAG: hypothetical protein RL095_3692 [Verrucomicrobiota bacterium]|jgi:hypothetical protein
MKQRIASALKRGLTIEGANINEINQALQAIAINSPIAPKRVTRAIASIAVLINSMGQVKYERGLGEYLDELERLMGMMPDANQPGPLPAIDDGKTAQIQMRVEPSRKTAYVRAAQEAGCTLAEWITRQCDPPAGFKN